MAVAGSWRAANLTPLEYDGATKWGTGVNPIHAIPESFQRGGTKLPLGSTGPGDVSPEIILGPVQWGYQAEDAQFYQGEDYRYIEVDTPNWTENTTGRGDRGGPGLYGQEVADYPAWGVYNDDDTTGEFPVGGPTGGAALRAESHESDIERHRLIAVPTPGVSGGWLNKIHGNVNTPRTSDPSQYEIATGLKQTSSHLENTRAVARGTDQGRAPIGNRLTGVKVKSYAKDINMGGGPGTPDMLPQQQDEIPKRPFFFRQGAMPPPEEHTWGEITYWTPIQRTVPDDAGATVTAQEATQQDSYGYTGEDGGWY
jgi:hypothetical protein